MGAADRQRIEREVSDAREQISAILGDVQEDERARAAEEAKPGRNRNQARIDELNRGIASMRREAEALQRRMIELQRQLNPQQR